MMGRFLVHSSSPGVLTLKHLNNAMMDNQQLHFVLAMVRELIERSTTFFFEF